MAWRDVSGRYTSRSQFSSVQLAMDRAACEFSVHRRGKCTLVHRLVSHAHVKRVGGQVATCLAGRLAGSSDSGEPDDCKVK